MPLKSASTAWMIDVAQRSDLIAALTGRRSIVVRNKDSKSLGTKGGAAFHHAWGPGFMKLNFDSCAKY